MEVEMPVTCSGWTAAQAGKSDSRRIGKRRHLVPSGDPPSVDIEPTAAVLEVWVSPHIYYAHLQHTARHRSHHNL